MLTFDTKIGVNGALAGHQGQANISTNLQKIRLAINNKVVCLRSTATKIVPHKGEIPMGYFNEAIKFIDGSAYCTD